MTTHEGTVGRYLSFIFAALSLGAGLIHFAESGDHFDVSWWHGAFFAVVAWLQLAWAAAVVFRAGRGLLAFGVALNVLVVAVWAVSRLWGVPAGPNAWDAEPVAFADALTTGLEVALVGLLLAVLWRPHLATRNVSRRLGRSGIGLGATGVFALATLALSPSFASGHHHAGADGHAEGHDAAGDHETGGHDTGDHGSGHGGHTAHTIRADGTSACERWGGDTGNSGHGSRGPVPPAPMDVATHLRLQRQVERSNAIVARYPTVADAKAAGYVQVSGYVPCIGAHFTKYGALGNGFDPSEPEVMLYGGIEADAPVVGLSYMVFADEEPEGFAGDTDVWHVHESLCIGPNGGVLGPGNASDEECAERGGENSDLGNLWMMHMWNVPGWESRWGLFSSEHPDLGGDLEDLQTR
jgi:hypothetical protein